jgi:hypothetical protein
MMDTLLEMGAGGTGVRLGGLGAGPVVCSGLLGWLGFEPPMLTRPCLYGRALPDLPHRQLVVRLGEVTPVDDLLHSLAADAEHLPDLGRAHEVSRCWCHVGNVTCHLTSRQPARHTRHMTRCAADRKTVKKLRRELRSAYVALDSAPREDENECQRTIGRYYGLRRAYAIVTGLDEVTIGNEVTGWYVQSEHYTPAEEADR